MSSVRGSRAAHKLLDDLRGAAPSRLSPSPSVHICGFWTLGSTSSARMVDLHLVAWSSIGGTSMLSCNGHGRGSASGALRRTVSTRVLQCLQCEAPRFGRSARNNVVTTLGSFLGYAFMAGHLSRDVASTLERVPCFTLDRLPRGPRWEDVPEPLKTVDRSTAGGRRDSVMLVLLTYGTRASQVTVLDDIRWREGQIVILPAERGRTVVVPITTSVGKALVRPEIIGSALKHLSLRI